MQPETVPQILPEMKVAAVLDVLSSISKKQSKVAWRYDNMYSLKNMKEQHEI